MRQQPIHHEVGGLPQPKEARPISVLRSGLQTAAQISKVARKFYVRFLQDAQILKQLNDVRNVRHVMQVNDERRACIAKINTHFLALERGEK